MHEQRIFVGRQAELERFREILEDLRGQAIVVVGQAGMGKTWLIDRMTELATQHPGLKCGWVRYEVTPTDSPDSIMELMMDNAFKAAKTTEGSFDKTDRRWAQWTSLLKLLPKGADIVDLIASLRRDPQKHTREQFLERLRLISTRMGSGRRALLVVDPEKYMCQGCADSWRLVMRELPEKVKFLFGQRPEDELINSSSFMALDNVIRLPPESLDVLATEEVDELIRLRADDIGQPAITLREAVTRYEGHPYAIQAALGIVKKTKQVEDLPQDPTPEAIATTQWQQVCQAGGEAIRLFEADAILEVAVPREVVQAISELDVIPMKRLLSEPYLRGLLREEGQGQRIYHAILADHIRGQIGQAEQQALHARAVLVYRTSLKEAREQHKAPDALAAIRLPEHVLAAEGPEAFVRAFADECTVPLLNLGLLDAAMGLSQRSLDVVEEGSAGDAAVLGNLGIIFRKRGDLDHAEQMHKKSLEVSQKLGRLEGVASQYTNLGVIYQTRGDLDGAEEMQKSALEINQKLGRLEGMANAYGNLGLIHQMRGDLDQAEQMHTKALEINQKLDALEGAANEYNNLGIVHRMRGDFVEAAKMHMTAIEINQKIGRLEGIADAYGNLALIYQLSGDLDKAEEMHTKALAINQRLGRPESMANQYGNLGVIYRQRGDLDKAEQMFNRTLEIHQKLGKLEGTATDYVNLGMLYRTRGDLARARESWEKAVGLFRKMGARDRMRDLQTRIDRLPKNGQ